MEKHIVFKTGGFAEEKTVIEVSLSRETLDALNAIFTGKYGRSEEKPIPLAVEYKAEDMEDDHFSDYEDVSPLTMDDVEKAMVVARERGVKPQAIKKMMRDKFRINSVIECPERRYADLVSEIYNLTA